MTTDLAADVSPLPDFMVEAERKYRDETQRGQPFIDPLLQHLCRVILQAVFADVLSLARPELWRLVWPWRWRGLMRG